MYDRKLIAPVRELVLFSIFTVVFIDFSFQACSSRRGTWLFFDVLNVNTCHEWNFSSIIQYWMITDIITKLLTFIVFTSTIILRPEAKYVLILNLHGCMLMHMQAKLNETGFQAITIFKRSIHYIWIDGVMCGDWCVRAILNDLLTMVNVLKLTRLLSSSSIYL